MRGLPKYFATKQDFLNCLADENLADDTKKILKNLLDGRFTWINGDVLEDGNDGVTDEKHKVVLSKDENNNDIRVQYELVENENAELFLLGFSVEEVENLLK